jgi:hypothetical protein
MKHDVRLEMVLSRLRSVSYRLRSESIVQHSVFGASVTCHETWCERRFESKWFSLRSVTYSLRIESVAQIQWFASAMKHDVSDVITRNFFRLRSVTYKLRIESLRQVQIPCLVCVP